MRKISLLLLFLPCIAYAYCADLQSMMDPPANTNHNATWLGGGVAISIKLSPHKYLWLFGDTFLGSISHKARHIKIMLDNTVPIDEMVIKLNGESFIL